METLEADACVVGAGFAGLAAAMRLVSGGREVVVLEARDRVGGRVWNREAADDTVLSVGGTWLGARQHRMFQLCHEAGLTTYDQYADGDTMLRLNGENHRYSGLLPKINPVALASLGLALKRLDWIAKKVPVDAPWEARNAKSLDSRTLGEWISSPSNVVPGVARTMLRTAMTTLFCTDPAEVSLLGACVLANGGGNFEYYVDSTITETHLVDGGVPELANWMAASLGEAVRVGAPVRQIAQTESGVEVTADSMAVRAQHVIVATPPVLAGRIHYDPPLPRAHSHLLQRLVPGAIIRVVTIYDRPFWRDDGLTGEAVYPESPVPVSIDQSPRSRSPGILSSYSVGPAAIEIARLGAEERRGIWIAALTDRFGPKARSPEVYLETDWSAEEWSLGGMIGHFAPGVLTTYGRALRESVGRIHWAGTEQATEMHGLMEGAVRSGEHAADVVLASLV